MMTSIPILNTPGRDGITYQTDQNTILNIIITTRKVTLIMRIMYNGFKYLPVYLSDFELQRSATLNFFP